MIIEFTRFIEAVSRATDFVEAELLNIPMYHEKRVAVLVNRMGTSMGLDEETVYALTMAGAMHDCALSEYFEDEFKEGSIRKDEINMANHCIAGEKVMQIFPFYEKVKGAVLYHHDRADGGGAMGMPACDTPLVGRLIHIADVADAEFSLYTMDPDKYQSMREWMRQQEGTYFDSEVLQVFFEAVDYDTLLSIAGENVIGVMDDLLPVKPVDIPLPILRALSEFFAHTTDYKSHFTWRHSLGVAEKAEIMGRCCGFTDEHCQKLYIAGALHDIGKLLITNDILEKPGKLSPEEYRYVQNHAMGTWELLHGIGGMEEIARWAALHHEKLDGSGYPFGYTAGELSFEERLMACIDIYQALVEKRPYKEGLSHEEAMAILRKMGAAGQLDSEIIEALNRCHEMHTSRKSQGTAVFPEPPRYEQEAWRCPVCGYVVVGELPEDFICPRCEQPGTIFEQI